ncbi:MULTISPECIES: carbohydrate-binding domain-containing protein [Clostridia]|uniref:carbohydrate-binding domain-containing protein n=1 Tax=Clostridia TaxID=186801 RepID=UPI001314E8D0|nr:carbohydrate-binding domain-containing protein [Eubacterium sp. AF22-9]
MIKLNKIKRNCVAAVILTMCLMTAGCARNSTSTTTASGGETTITSDITKEDTDVTHADDAENYRVSITGDFTVTSDTSDGVTQSGSVYTITKAGEYTVAGLLSEGQLIVDAGDENEVTIVLNGTSITCSSGSPIYVKNASEVKIKSEENSFNEVIDNRAEATEDSSDDTGNAAIYAACDLKLVGKGALVVTANYNNGIQSKDDLSIKNVIVKVTAVNNSVKGNDAVDIESGNVIAISAKGDGIKTSNSSLSNKGNQKGIVTITGGNIDVYTACDGIDAAYGVDISGDGNLNIYTDTYSEYSEEVTTSGSSSGSNSSTNKTASANTVSYVAAPDNISNAPGGNMGGGTPPDMNGGNAPDMSNGNAPDMNGSSGGGMGGNNGSGMPGGNNQSGNSSKKSYSTKGIKADSEINISGFTININSTDDGIHANSDSGVLETGEDGKGTIVINGGTITISSGDDGMHADKQLDVNDGYINVVTSYEGLEAMTINLNGGKVYVYAADDGINACTGDGKTTPIINVNGGYIDVTTASGDTDGIDSNGNYVQTGGFVLVKGGSSSGNVSGSIDVDGTVTITGGTCVALGGVCETPVNSVNAYVLSSVSFSYGSYSLKDASGNEVISFTVDGSFSNGWICSDTLTTGTSYTLYRGSDSIADWTQESGTMGASSTGGFGGGRR